MQTTYTYAVINADNATMNVRANRLQAFAELRFWREQFPQSSFALVLETCAPSGCCTEEYIINFDQSLES